MAYEHICITRDDGIVKSDFQPSGDTQLDDADDGGGSGARRRGATRGCVARASSY